MEHKCLSRASCLDIAANLTAGQDTWFCIGSTTVSVQRLSGGWFRVTSTNRKTAHRDIIVCFSPSEVQAECRHYLRACPYLIADNLVACDECSRHLASFNVASASAEQS